MGRILFMKDASLKLAVVGPPAGTDAEYNCDVHTAEVTAKAGDETTYQTLCPDGTFSELGATTYALHLVAGQDWSATGLARFLWDHAGELATFELQVHGAAVAWAATAPGMTGTVRLLDPTYGGEAETFPELDVEMPCQGRPELLDAAPVAAEAEAA